MKRNISRLSAPEYDLVVVGGGVYGACAAWDAALRGLSVALLERNDFGAATSANSSRIVHGGLRYLQHADLKRVRESVHERTALLRIAPHLAAPLAFVMPTYGHAATGKELMAMALAVNDALSLERRSVPDPARRIPTGRTVSRQACLDMLPGIHEDGLTGAAIWYDAQFYNTERLTLSFVLSACSRGARVANYAEVTGLHTEGNAVVGVHARDRLSGEAFDIRGKTTLIAAGPWTERLLNSVPCGSPGGFPLTKVFSVVTRALSDDYAFAVAGRPIYADRRAIIKRNTQLIFAIPWRGHSIIGSYNLPHNRDPNAAAPTEVEITAFLNAFNEAYPAASLQRSDVLHVFSGLLPADEVVPNAMASRHRIIDHAASDQSSPISGLVSMVGVKYTTARRAAQEAVDLVVAKLGLPPRPSRSDITPLQGGNIPSFDALVDEAQARGGPYLDKPAAQNLAHNYGSHYTRILDIIRENPSLGDRVTQSLPVLKAEIVHAVRHEMAVKLADVVHRRTELGGFRHPGPAAIETCANVMAAEANWDRVRRDSEIEEV